MKKIISLIICILLLMAITIPAYATNIDAIKPSGNVIVIGLTNEDVPVHSPLPNINAGPGTIIIIPNTFSETNNKSETPINQNKTLNNDSAEVNNTEEATENDTETSVELPEESTLRDEIFLLTNEERLKEDLSILSYNYDIQDAADLRAKECAELFSHTRPDGSSCYTVVEKFEYQVTGENLIKADKPIADAETLMKTWMNSPGHKANILLPEYTSISIGIYETENIIYAVQIFMG